MAARIVWSKEPRELLGKSLIISMKDGGQFHFKVTESGVNFIRGYDDEGLNLQISINDILEIWEG